MKKKIKSISLYSLFIASFLCATVSCKKETKDEPTSEPEVVITGELSSLTTITIGNITASSADGGGSITSNGGTTITSRGVCWSSSALPTTDDAKSTDGAGNGFFTSNLSGLSDTATYYVRAYAINSAGTAYGNQVIFTTF